MLYFPDNSPYFSGVVPEFVEDYWQGNRDFAGLYEFCC
jgi:hypothetical protein